MEHFTEALEHFDPEVEWQQRNLWRWWRQWGAMVHHHHDIEEEILFPWLRTKVDLPEEVSTDHEKLLEQMEHLSSFQASFKAAATAAERKEILTELRNLFSTFKDFMNGHLDLEDNSITHELLCEHFSYDEYEKNTQEIALKGGVFNAAKTTRDMLSWFEQGMTEEEVKEFYTQELPKHIPMPRVVEYTNKLRWKDRYFTHHVALLESIIQGTKKPSKKVEKERRTKKPCASGVKGLFDDVEDNSGSDTWEIEVEEEEEDDSSAQRASEEELTARQGKEVLYETKRVVGLLGSVDSITLSDGANLLVTVDTRGMGVKGKRRYLSVSVSSKDEERSFEVGSGGRPAFCSVAFKAPAGEKVTVRAKSKMGPIKATVLIERL